MIEELKLTKNKIMYTLIVLATLFIFTVLLIDAVDEDDLGTHLKEYKSWNNLVAICLVGFWILVGLAIVAIAVHNI